MPPKKLFGNTKGPFVSPAQEGKTPKNEETDSYATIKSKRLPMNPELAALIDIQSDLSLMGGKNKKIKSKKIIKTKTKAK
jgi:hypothetical protein